MQIHQFWDITRHHDITPALSCPSCNNRRLIQAPKRCGDPLPKFSEHHRKPGKQLGIETNLWLEDAAPAELR